ncbi:outer membrane efflux protein, partial [Burkholderia sp. TJI49]
MPFIFGTPLRRRVPWRVHTLFAALLVAGVVHAQQAPFTLDA